MKDVLRCDKPRGAAKKLDPRISEWGNPPSIVEFRDFGLGNEIKQIPHRDFEISDFRYQKKE